MAQKSFRKSPPSASPREDARPYWSDLHLLMAKDIQLIIDLIEVLFEDYSPKTLSLYQLIHLIEHNMFIRILAHFKGDYQASADYLGMALPTLRRMIAKGDNQRHFKITQK